jgi:heterodisulfide reductase subunit C
MIERETGIPVAACYQCRKCSNGCPVVFAMDRPPHQITRMIQLGLEEEILRSTTLWICASCETCSTRCPNDIEIAALMDHLRSACARRKVANREEGVLKFHNTFLSSVRRNGRVFELGMIGSYKLKTKAFLQDARLGWEMFKRGKLKLFPRRIRGRREIKRIFEQTRGK